MIWLIIGIVIAILIVVILSVVIYRRNSCPSCYVSLFNPSCTYSSPTGLTVTGTTGSRIAYWTAVPNADMYGYLVTNTSNTIILSEGKSSGTQIRIPSSGLEAGLMYILNVRVESGTCLASTYSTLTFRY